MAAAGKLLVCMGIFDEDDDYGYIVPLSVLRVVA